MTDLGGGTRPSGMPGRGTGAPTEGGGPGTRGHRDGGGGGGGSTTPSPAICELCGGPVLERHCKIVCLNCGYQRDCSDP